MFAINTRVASKGMLAMYGDIVAGKVVGIETYCPDTGDALLRIEWDADTWSEYREVDSVWSDELVDLLAV